MLNCNRYFNHSLHFQKTDTDYDDKTDIFALGLICFEILWEMPTDSEKSKVNIYQI